MIASRLLLGISSLLTEPVCWCSAQIYRARSRLLPGEFDFSATKASEIGQRVIRVVAAAVAAPAAGALALIAKPFRYLGFQLQQNGYTHVKGDAPEKPFPADGRYTAMTWNVCAIGGGLGRDHGGVIGWQDRLDAIVEEIRQADPDILSLNEIYDRACGDSVSFGFFKDSLIEKLKDRYAHFFLDMGANTWGSVSGHFVASKFAVENASFTPFSSNATFDAQKGFFSFDIRTSPQTVTRFIATHLMYDVKPETYERDSTIRMRQIAQIVRHIAQEQLLLIFKERPLEKVLLASFRDLKAIKGLPPTIVLGDLNIDRDSAEGKKVLQFLDHGYTANEPTRTNRFLRMLWDPSEPYFEETIDYISGVKNTGVKFVSVRRIPADDGKDSHTVLSDHDALLATIQN